MKSPHHSEHKINDTHVPYPKDQPSPDRPWSRGAVLNPAAFVDPEPTTEQ
jgi:hypothetical protein